MIRNLGSFNISIKPMKILLSVHACLHPGHIDEGHHLLPFFQIAVQLSQYTSNYSVLLQQGALLKYMYNYALQCVYCFINKNKEFNELQWFLSF